MYFGWIHRWTCFRKIDTSTWNGLRTAFPHGIYIYPTSVAFLLVPFLVTIVLVRFIANT